MNNLYSALLPYVGNATERNSTGKTANSQANSGGGFDDLLTSINKREAEKNKPVNNSSDGLSKFVQQVVMSMDDSLANIFSAAGDEKKDKFSTSLDEASTLYGVDSVFSSSASAGIFDFDYDSFVNGAGPLPAYLKLLDKSLNLTAEQSQKLRDIAWDNRNIVKSPESVKALGEQLAAAGIG